MKQSLTLVAAGVLAAYAQAPNSLPQCGQTCVNNMLQVAVSDFGCDANDLAGCACCNAVRTPLTISCSQTSIADRSF